LKMTKQPRTWFIDFDGTLVTQRSHMMETDTILEGTKAFFNEVVDELDHVIITTARTCDDKERIERFLESHGIRVDHVICGLPTGARMLVNDMKPDGTQTAYAFNLERDRGIDTSIFQ
jgi:hydroxymethylpyrimidine pyrophosphatase-like HAD family hydrolase